MKRKRIKNLGCIRLVHVLKISGTKEELEEKKRFQPIQDNVNVLGDVEAYAYLIKLLPFLDQGLIIKFAPYRNATKC